MKNLLLFGWLFLGMSTLYAAHYTQQQAANILNKKIEALEGNINFECGRRIENIVELILQLKKDITVFLDARCHGSEWDAIIIKAEKVNFVAERLQDTSLRYCAQCLLKTLLQIDQEHPLKNNHYVTILKQTDNVISTVNTYQHIINKIVHSIEEIKKLVPACLNRVGTVKDWQQIKKCTKELLQYIPLLKNHVIQSHATAAYTIISQQSEHYKYKQPIELSTDQVEYINKYLKDLIDVQHHKHTRSFEEEYIKKVCMIKKLEDLLNPFTPKTSCCVQMLSWGQAYNMYKTNKIPWNPKYMNYVKLAQSHMHGLHTKFEAYHRNHPPI